MAKTVKKEGEDQGSKPETKIKTNIVQKVLERAKILKKKPKPAPPQYTDVKLKATEAAKFHEADEEFYATRVIADKLIKSGQAIELQEEGEENEEV